MAAYELMSSRAVRTCLIASAADLSTRWRSAGESMPQIVRKATDQFGHLHLYVAFLLVQNPEQLQPLMGVREGIGQVPECACQNDRAVRAIDC